MPQLVDAAECDQTDLSASNFHFSEGCVKVAMRSKLAADAHADYWPATPRLHPQHLMQRHGSLRRLASSERSSISFEVRRLSALTASLPSLS